MRLKGKVALVTGAGAGIGKAIAVMFCREGAVLIVNDKNEEAAVRTAEEILSFGTRALPIHADVADSTETQHMVEKALARFEKIDILVSNAGIVDYRPFSEITLELWDYMMATHLKGAFNCTKAVIGDMIARRTGCIIYISSTAGITGTPYHVHYSTAKAGLIGFTRSLARELSPYSIRVNAVAPGPIDTAAYRRAQEFFRKVMPNFTAIQPPLGIGQPDDVAAACTYLASDEAKYVTGQVLSPNGGSWI